MKKEEVCALIERIGVIPAVRVSSAEDARFAAEAVNRGGIPIVEITMTVPNACELMSQLVSSHPKMIVGAGTVLTKDVAAMCVDSGASFLTSPSLNFKTLEFASRPVSGERQNSRKPNVGLGREPDERLRLGSGWDGVLARAFLKLGSCREVESNRSQQLRRCGSREGAGALASGGIAVPQSHRRGDQRGIGEHCAEERHAM